MPDEGARYRECGRQITLAEPAALGQDFLPDPVHFPDPSYGASEPQASFGDLRASGAGSLSHPSYSLPRRLISQVIVQSNDAPKAAASPSTILDRVFAFVRTHARALLRHLREKPLGQEFFLTLRLPFNPAT